MYQLNIAVRPCPSHAHCQARGYAKWRTKLEACVARTRTRYSNKKT